MAYRGLGLQLYNNDLFTPRLVEAGMEAKAEGLTFGTTVPGGFATLSFFWPCSFTESWRWYAERFFYRIVVSYAEKVVWEGRLEDVELRAEGVDLTFYGYFRNCYDIPFNDTTSYTSGTHYADEIIKDIIRAACDQIYPDFRYIESPNFNLAPITFTNNGFPGDHFKRLGKIGDGKTSHPWYFAVWENRMPYFQRRKVGVPDWHVSKADLDLEAGFNLRRSARDMWNEVAVIYTTYDGMQVITPFKSDDDSKEKWNITRRGVFSMGQGGTDTARWVRNAYLRDHSSPMQEGELVITGNVKDEAGAAHHLWEVRAGDLIQIDDLIPEPEIVRNPELETLRIFHIKETEFDAARWRLTVVPDWPGGSADIMLARADLGARW